MLSELAPRWLSQLSPPPSEAERQELASWLPELTGAGGDLFGRVALWARANGLAGRPVSFSLGRVLPLQAILSELEGDAQLGRQLALITADAHATGALERARADALAPAIEGAPVLRIGPAAVAFAAGPLNAALLDPLLGRLLRFSIGQGCRILALELSAAGPVTPLLTRTLAAFEESDHPAQELWVIGARPAPPAGSWSRLRFAAELQTQLDRWLS